MDCRGVVFDLDGTLADTLRTIAAALNHGLAGLGLPAREPDEVRRMVGDGIVVLCERALPPEQSAQHAELLARVRAFYDRNVMLHCRLYDGVKETIRSLKEAGARLGILSNKPHELTVATVAGLGLTDMFDVVLGHRAESARKPDPATLRWVLEQLGVAAGQALYVGDTPIDMQTARAAGVAAVAVTWGFRDRAELLPYQPEHVVDRPGQIAAIFRRLRGGDGP